MSTCHHCAGLPALPNIHPTCPTSNSAPDSWAPSLDVRANRCTHSRRRLARRGGTQDLNRRASGLRGGPDAKRLGDDVASRACTRKPNAISGARNVWYRKLHKEPVMFTSFLRPIGMYRITCVPANQECSLFLLACKSLANLPVILRARRVR